VDEFGSELTLERRVYTPLARETVKHAENDPGVVPELSGVKA